MILALGLMGLCHYASAQQTNKPLSDIQLRKRLIGVWVIDDISPSGKVRTTGTNTFGGDGSYTGEWKFAPVANPTDKNTDTWTETGRWQFSNGRLITSITAKKGVTTLGTKGPRSYATTLPKPYSWASGITFESDDELLCTSKGPGTDDKALRTSKWRRKK